MATAAMPHSGKGSALVNTDSVTGLQGNKKPLKHSTTKGGVYALTDHSPSA
jgi:hypothetical protein